MGKSQPTLHLQHYSRRQQPLPKSMQLFFGLSLAFILAGCAQPGPLNLATPSSGVSPTSGPQPTRVIPTSGPLSGTPTSVPIDGVPTEPPAIPTEPAIEVPTIVVTPPPAGEAAWIALKTDYTPFVPPRTFATPGSVLLWWYDPVTAQFVELGWITSPLTAQAQFRLRGRWVEVLEIPYEINVSYGLNLDPSVLDRIRRAGYSVNTIETFVYMAPDFVPLQ